MVIDKEAKKEMKERTDELFQYDVAITDEDDEVWLLSMFNTASARLIEYYNKVIENQDDEVISINEPVTINNTCLKGGGTC